jgi:hypothetical protein
MLPNQKQAALPNRYIPIEDFIREFEAGVTDMGEVFDRYESTERWTPDRLQVIRDIAHSDQRPGWLNDDALSLIDTAYDYSQQAGGAPLPTELSSLLDTFPSFETSAEVEAAPVTPGVYAPAPGSEYTLGGEYTPQIPTTPTGGEAQYYGMTQEEWQSLGLAKQAAMRTGGTSTAAALTTGVVAGAQGGVPGILVGVGLAAAFSAAGDNPVTRWIGNALDVFARGAKRGMGLVSLSEQALIGMGVKDTGVTFDQLFHDMDSAYNAFLTGEQLYRTAAPMGSIYESEQLARKMFGLPEQAPNIPVWGGPQAPLENRQLPMEQIGPDALVEYFQRLEAGERPADINAEFEQRYGYGGLMRDLGGMIFLDPANYAPGAVVRKLGKVTSAVLGTAAGPIAKGTEVSIGPVQALKNTKARMMEMSFADTQQVTPLIRWMSGWTKEGTPKALEKPVYSNAISKQWGYMTHQTPVSRGSEFISMGSQYESVLINHLEGDPFKYMEAYDLIAKNQVSAASEIGMKALGGPEMGAQIGAMRDTSPKMHAALDDYQSPGMSKLRADMQAIAKATGASMDEVAVKLADVRDGKLNAQTWLAQIAKTGDEAAKAIDEATLAVYADAIGKVPWSEKQLTAKLFATSLTGKRDWAGAYFGVAPDGLPMRLNNLRKSVQGALLLDLSIPYLAQNVLNNQVLLIREGGVMSLIPVNRAAYLDEQLGAGIRPSRLHEGLVTDVTSPASFAELQAQKPGLLTTIEKGVSKVRKLGAARIISGIAEGVQREAGWVTFHKKFMAENKRLGRGLDYMPADMADLIDNTNPALKRAIYGEIAASKTRPEMVKRVTDLLGGKRQVTAEALMPDLARRLGMDEGHLRETLDHPQIGVLDWIKENIPTDATPEVKRQKMADLSVLIQKRMNEMSREQLLYKAEKAANTQGAEGALGAMEVLDDPAILRGEQRLNDWQAWEHVWDMKRDLTEEQFGSRVQMEYNRQKATYKTLHQNIRASYLGVLEKLGVDSRYGKFMTDNLIGDEKLWTDYYDTVQKEYRQFFKETKGKVEPSMASAAWLDLKDRLSTLYNDTYKGSLDLQAKRDTQLIDLLGEKYGQDVRGMAEEWLTGIRKLDQEMFERMEAFRASLDDLDPDQKGAAWTAFLNKEHKPMIMLRMAQNREMARRVYVAADAAERAAPPTVRPRAEPAQPPAPPAAEIVAQARAEWVKKTMGMTEEQHANITEIRQVASEFGIPSAKPDGSPDTGFNSHVLAIVNKYTGQKYNKLEEVSPALVRRALEDRAKVKASPETPPIEPARVYTEPINEGEVLQLAQEIDAQRIEDTLNGWAKDVGRGTSVGRKEAQAPVSNPDPDPVGVAPPGAVAGVNKTAPLYDIFQDGMNEQVAPALRELERMLVEPDPIAGMEGTIPPDLMRRILLYAEQQGNNLADTKLAASKFATMSTDMAMLNYNQRYGVDDIANAVFPYQFWFTRNAVNWALSAIDRPYWFAWNHRIREAQEKMQREEPGFPERLKGKLRISAPFLPDDWGGSIYYDPMHQIFPFEAITTGLDKTLQRDFSNQMRRAQQIVYERMENGDVSEQEAEEALRMQTGAIWDDAYAQAQSDLENEVASPLDLVTTMISPAMDISWALERMGLKQPRNFGPPPSIATIQNLTSFLTPGGVNIPESIQRFLGAAEGKNRGDLWDYYIAREMSNMAGTGADPTQIMKEMVEKQGPLYTQAVDTVGKQGAIKQFASIFWADFFPEGEQEQRRLQPLFEQAADQGKIGAFLDEHPEYAARLMRSKWEDPEEMMRTFVRSSVWEEYLGADPLEQRAIREEFGDLFTENFLNKETRNYESIDTATLVQWARALKGVVPENAPETPAMDVELPGGAINERYNAYVAWRDAQPGYGLYNVMYGLPEGMRGNFRMQHPEVAQYEEARYIFIADNPELMPYIIGEDNALFGAPLEVQMEVYDYRAEKAELFPLIGLKNDYYWTLDKVGQKAYLRANPDLKNYWDWNRERVDELSAAAFYYVKGETGIEKLRDASYEAPYQVDFRKFDPALTLEIGRQTMMGRQLGSGALASLRLMWEREGEPLGSFDKWLEEVLYAFAPSQ